MGPMGGVERVQGLGFNRFGFRVLGVLPPKRGSAYPESRTPKRAIKRETLNVLLLETL